MSTGHTLLDEIDGFLDSVGPVKTAESSADEGHVQNQGDSGTSHPSKSTDDGTQDATEGSRSSENSSDVKSGVPGLSVDDASEDKMEGGSEHPLTTAKPTGEDPANETASADGLIGGDAGKDHAGKDTTHPAKADFGGKYASTKEAAVSLLGRINDYNAKVAALNTPQPRAAEKKAMAKCPGCGKMTYDDGKCSDCDYENKSEKSAMEKCPGCGKMTYDDGKCSDCDYEKKAVDADEEVGRQAAKVAADELSVSDEQRRVMLISMAKEAFDDANQLADFLGGIELGDKDVANAQAQKTAAVRIQATEFRNKIKRAMEDPSAGADAMAYGGEGEQPGVAGEGAGSGGPPPEGAMPPGGPEGAMPPSAGGPEGEMGGGVEQDQLMQIIQELQAAGIDPEILAEIDPADLAQAIAESQGGMGGEPGMEGGGMEGAPGMEGGGMGGGGGMIPPEAMGQEAPPELAPAAAM